MNGFETTESVYRPSKQIRTQRIPYARWPIRSGSRARDMLLTPRGFDQRLGKPLTANSSSQPPLVETTVNYTRHLLKYF